MQTADLTAGIDKGPPWKDLGPKIDRLRRLLESNELAEAHAVRGMAYGTIGRALSAQGAPARGRSDLEKALEIHTRHLPEEAARSRIYIAAALRAEGGDTDFSLLERALDTLDEADRNLENLTWPTSPPYARETRMYLLYERARCLSAMGRHDDAIDNATRGLELSSGRPWPTLGLLRTRAVSSQAIGRDMLMRRDLRALESHVREAPRQLREVAQQMLADGQNGAETTFY